jgi:hypothetical protein
VRVSVLAPRLPSRVLLPPSTEDTAGDLGVEPPRPPAHPPLVVGGGQHQAEDKQRRDQAVDDHAARYRVAGRAP